MDIPIFHPCHEYWIHLWEDENPLSHTVSVFFYICSFVIYFSLHINAALKLKACTLTVVIALTAPSTLSSPGSSQLLLFLLLLLLLLLSTSNLFHLRHKITRCCNEFSICVNVWHRTCLQQKSKSNLGSLVLKPHLHNSHCQSSLSSQCLSHLKRRRGGFKKKKLFSKHKLNGVKRSLWLMLYTQIKTLKNNESIVSLEGIHFHW